LRIIRDLLAETAVEAGRRPGDVHLLAVSKKQPLEKIVEAAAAGQLDFGENIVQEGISEQRPESLGDLNVCIQVNIDEEASKSGVPPSDVAELARTIAGLPRLRLRGLMCLPAVRDSLDEQRAPFARTRELAESLAREGLVMDTLSMGMSADFRAAIMEGATIVRIGTAVFGPRDA
jgi:uncharacterized pyridoxal phosphate-containing UPF0001 family protein